MKKELKEQFNSKSDLEEFIDFLLKDINSNVLKEYIKDQRDTIAEIKRIVNDDKITGIEGKLIIKDLLEE